jgi:predicted metalloprotease
MPSPKTCKARSNRCSAVEALRAAAAIGDDRLQEMATGRVMPERFTHGSSAQRVAAFGRGMNSGDPGACGIGSRRARSRRSDVAE